MSIHWERMLICSVRGCRLPLKRLDQRMVCSNGHSFDIARSGYVNLLQPQERRSKHPGDTAEAVLGRRRLHDSGATRPLLDAIVAFAAAGPSDSILDSGCGEGFYLGNLTAAVRAARGSGVDISTRAIDAAARRYPSLEWVVANADRFVPYADQSFSLILSITARRNAAEFRRLIHPDGRVVIAVPAPDDLIELRGALGRSRVNNTVVELSPAFHLEDQRRATCMADVPAESVEDFRHSIYRPIHSGQLAAMTATLSLDLLLLRPTR